MSDLNPNQPSDQQLDSSSLPEEEVHENFDVQDTYGIKSVKDAVKFTQQGLIAYTAETDRKFEELKKLFAHHANATNDAMSELKNLLIPQATDIKKVTPTRNPSPHTEKAENSIKYPNFQSNSEHEKTTNSDSQLSALAATMLRLESKIDNMEATRPNGFSAIRKLAPDNMPGPRYPNNLLNYQDMRIEDLSQSDSATYEAYVKNIWPEALSSAEIDSDSRPMKNATHRFICNEELKNASIDNWHKLFKIQRTLVTEMTPYKFWPTRIIGNLSGDFETVARFIRFKNPSWLLTVEAFITVMRNYNGVQPPISEIASMTRNVEESDLQFLRRLRTVFNRMSPAMADSPASHDVLHFALRKHVPSLWARIEDRGMAEFSSQALESTIELAAQASRVGILSTPPKPDGEIFSFGRDETLPISEEPCLHENAYPIESDRCYICRNQGHWSRSCPNNRPNHPYKTKAFPSYRNRDRPHVKTNQPRYLNSSTQQQFRSSKMNNSQPLKTQGKVFATEEERLEACAPDTEFHNEEGILDTDDAYLHDFLEHNFNHRNTAESNLIEPNEQ
ncbi:hypothetical protein HI914_00288 [Erysiphe necator]|nr:hypothetical protein HI914_00288 [Erysiphe necator]